MSGEIVKYGNQFNNQALRKFSALEIDLLMAICAKMRNHGTTEETFQFDDLKRLMELDKNLTSAQFAQLLISMNRRLLAMNFEFTDGQGAIHQFALFSDFVTDANSQTLAVSVNKKFAFLLNDLTSGFTRFELAEFTNLHSTYAKECYRRLRQFRQTGVWKVSIEEFRRLLDVPESYRASSLSSRVLKPIEHELKPLLNLRIHKKFEKQKRGRPRLAGLEFEFRPERVQGGAGAPVVPISAAARLEAAKKSLRDVQPRRFGVSGWGEVWWSRAAFDVGVARDHLTGAIDSADCPVCAFDARNVASHAERADLLTQGWGETTLF